jgi:pimeloyl-ACP methyl ester carboxylesterase
MGREMFGALGAILLCGSVTGCAVELGGREELGHDRYAAESQRPCFVVFVHGRGDDRTGWSQAQLETYWAPDADRDGATDHQYSLTAWAAEERGCRVYRAGYDGSAAFWSERAAGRVARDVAAWIDEEGIGPGELVLVGHSMGGLVVRWIVNQGCSAARTSTRAARRTARSPR